jgi:hypothetical protein
MSENNKFFTARQAAQAVLAKTYEILAKSEELKKYEAENSTKPGVKYGKLETNQKATERDYDEYEVKKPSFKDSTGKRLEKQVSPSNNPKEAAEGNNKPDGMEPRYEFKDKVKKELAKEDAAHIIKSEKLEKGDWKKIHDKLKREGYSEESANKIDGSIKAKLGKAENPDEKADAELGEKVENDVEEHFKENAEAEQEEGHGLMAKPEDKGQNVIPRLIGSAKLSKFMEHLHSKRKNAQAQSPEAVGKEAPGAPAPRSTESGKPEIKKS